MARDDSAQMVIRIAGSLEDLKRALAEGRVAIDNTATSLGKLTAGLRGDKLIQDAQRVVDAVQKIGGASALTEKQQARVNAQVSEAIAKYRALGQQAPKDLLELEQATHRVEQKTGLLSTTLGKMVAGLTVAGAAMAVRSASDYADSLDELATGAGISTEALQRLGYAATQNGAEMRTVVDAIQKVGEKLTDGKIDEAASKLGLSVAHLRSLSPDEAFLQLAEAVAKVPDPMERAAAGTDIFDKSWKRLAPAIMADMRKVGEDATIMSESTIKSVGSVSDTFGKLKTVGASVIAVVFAPLVPIIDLLAAGATKISGAFSGFWERNGPPAQFKRGWTEIRQTVESIVGIAGKLPSVMPAPKAPIGTVPSLSLSPKEMNDLRAEMDAQYRIVHENSVKLSADAAAYAAEIKKIREAATGKTAIDEAKKQIDALKDIRQWWKYSGDALDEYRDTLEAAIWAYRRMGDAAAAARLEQLRADSLIQSSPLGGGFLTQAPSIYGTNEAGNLWSRDLPGAAQMMLALPRIAEGTKITLKYTTDWDAALKNVGDSFRQLASTSGEGGIGRVAQSVANIVGAMEMGRSASVGLRDGLKNATTTGEKFALVAANVAKMVSAMDQATQSSNKWEAMVGGASTGASIGSAGGGWGALAGALIGGAIGFFRGQEEEDSAYERWIIQQQQVQQTLQNAKKDFREAAGGAQQLYHDLALAGVGTGLLQQALAAPFLEEFQRDVALINEQLAAWKTRIEGINKAAAGLQLVAEGFIAPFDKLAGGDADDAAGKLLELATKGQAAFGRMGDYAAATFGKMFQETGDLIGSLEAMGETLDILIRAEDDFGLHGSAALDQLLGLRRILSQNDDLAKQLQGLSQLMDGLGLASMGSLKLATSFGADLSAIYAEFQARGADSTQTMLLMQPQLQKLWEFANQYGVSLGADTDALLEHAKAMGIVGPDMKSVNDQMLDVLKEIKQVLLDMSTGVREFGASAVSAFRDASAAAHDLGVVVNGVGKPGPGGEVPDSTIISENPTYWLPPSNAYRGGFVTARGVQYLREGGNVLRMLARGTDTVPAMLTPGEFVMPRGAVSRIGVGQLQYMARGGVVGGAGGGKAEVHVHFHVGSREIAEEIIPDLGPALRAAGF